MEFKIKETGEIKELSIIDPKTGTDWSSDFFGNHGGWNNCEYDETAEIHEISKEDFEWWEDLASEYEKADYRAYEIAQTLDDREQFENELANFHGDLEYLTAHMNEVCDEYE